MRTERTYYCSLTWTTKWRHLYLTARTQKPLSMARTVTIRAASMREAQDRFIELLASTLRQGRFW